MQKIILKGYPDSFHNSHFLPLLKNQNRYLVLKGGAGSGKSRFAALKLLDRLFFENVKHRLLIVRKTLKSVRKSAYQLIKDYISTFRLNDHFKINSTEMTIEYLHNGNQIIAAGMDDPEKIKSIERITGVWIEESTEINYDDFTQIDLRLRGELGTYKQIILSFNPIDENNWINKIFFQKMKEDCFIDHSTVDNNEFIDIEYMRVLDRLKGEDENKYNIYRKGLWGKLEDVIYSNWTVIDRLPNNFDEVIYGLDFGFNNPSTLVKIGFKDTLPFIEELLYETNLTNSQLIERMKTVIHNHRDNMYGDTSEPARIEEIKQAGFNIYPSDKSVIDGIDYVKRNKLHIHKDSDNIIKEINQYSYKKDKNGNILEEPVKFMDHAMDAIRYALYTHRKTLEPAMIGEDPDEYKVEKARIFR